MRALSAAIFVSVVGIGILAPDTCLAQEAGSSFRSIQVQTRPGDRLVVTDAAGARVRGRLDAASDAMIVLRTSGGRVEFAATEVTEVRRQADRVIDGTLWGLAIGAGAGFVVGLLLDESRGEGTWLAPQVTAAGAGFGALGGWLGDLAGRHDDVLFRAAPARARTLVAPLVARGRIGVRVSLAF